MLRGASVVAAASASVGAAYWLYGNMQYKSPMLVSESWRLFVLGWHFEPIPKSIPSQQPKRVVFIRHGESVGNVDPSVYTRMPDWKVPLTEKGKEQARMAGSALAELIKDEPDKSVEFYVSPYYRTRDTLREMVTMIPREKIRKVYEEPRIREQEFSNGLQQAEMQQKLAEERHSFGFFFYRIPGGESGADVYDRVTTFLGTLMRKWAFARDNGEDLESRTVVIVSHGLTLRMLLARYFHWPVEVIHSSSNPKNAQLIVLDRCSKAEILARDLREASPPKTHYHLDLSPENAAKVGLERHVAVQRPRGSGAEGFSTERL